MKYVILALLLFPSVASASTTYQAPAASEDVVESAKPICREVRSLGSRMARSRTCLTQRQWAERDQREWQRGAAMSSSPTMIGSLPRPSR